MDTTRNNQHPASSIQDRRSAFTLVELLVVITIIGILVALVTVAASGALKKGRQTAIKVELDNLGMALETYKDTNQSYPPNTVIDDTSLTTEPPTSPTPLDETQVFTDLKLHMKQVASRSREPQNLLRVLVGLAPEAPNASDFPKVLDGGMTAGEALVFWLGGFSSDPRYPISGEGGPAYAIPSLGASDNATLDPIESRKWVFPFEGTRLGPRDAVDGFFDESPEAGERFIEYRVTINGEDQLRRINFWQYSPRNSTQPYLYFDTSRHLPSAAFDPPAASELSGLGPDGMGLHVHAIKRLSESAGATLPIQYVNPDKFQILHAGVDDEWGAEEAFELMSAHGVAESGGDPTDPDDYLLYPDGPFTADVADTIVNFTTGTLEDAQP